MTVGKEGKSIVLNICGGLVIGLFGLLAGLVMGRDADLRRSVNQHLQELDRHETSEQKTSRIDTRIVKFWSETAKPDLREMEHRIMAALKKENK